MIVLNLCCQATHHFEGWFASSAEFDRQLAAGLVTCPQCNSAQIQRLPSGPRVISRERNAPIDTSAAASAPPVSTAAPTAQTPPAMPANGLDMDKVMRVLKSVVEAAAKAEDVADRFADEARKIHYGDAPEREIRGRATLAETQELLEEGIPVLPLPDISKPH